MIPQELKNKLSELLSLPAETEVIEFKEAKNDYDFNKLGKYFSALSNEANLKGKPFAWLVFGVNNRHEVGGSNYPTNRPDLDHLKFEIAEKVNNRLTFIEIYEIPTPQGRVILFQVPAAPQGIPVSFGGFYFGRDGETTGALNIQEIEQIRNQVNQPDWSATICPGATLSDLDPSAILYARSNFKEKFPKLAAEADAWDDTTFLNKAKVLQKGKITNAAIILLGRPESEYLISPATAKIRWVLKEKSGAERDYQIFSCPLLLAAEEAYSKIRNLKYRYMRGNTIFPEEIDQYEPYVIREAINNAIAHQDYSMAGYINVIENEDGFLTFSNLGSFIPGSIDRVITDNAPEEYYRNRFLVHAMFNLKMVDTIGSGIRKMFEYQRRRFFPMPDYDLAGNKVTVTITGKVLDMNYANALAKNTGLSLFEIMLLDRLQKGRKLTHAECELLRKKKLIEGRSPNIYISAKIAKVTGQKATYSKTKGFDKQYYLDLIMKAVEEHQSLTRHDIDELLFDKLPERYNESQKKNKISNIISELRRGGIISNRGTDKNPVWVLIN